jgi:hypothetical protein
MCAGGLQLTQSGLVTRAAHVQTEGPQPPLPNKSQMGQKGRLGLNQGHAFIFVCSNFEITEGMAHRRRLRNLTCSLKPICSDNAFVTDKPHRQRLLQGRAGLHEYGEPDLHVVLVRIVR